MWIICWNFYCEFIASLNLSSILGNTTLGVSIVRNSGVPTKIRTRGCWVRSADPTSMLSRPQLFTGSSSFLCDSRQLLSFVHCSKMNAYMLEEAVQGLRINKIKTIYKETSCFLICNWYYESYWRRLIRSSRDPRNGRQRDKVIWYNIKCLSTSIALKKAIVI